MFFIIFSVESGGCAGGAYVLSHYKSPTQVFKALVLTIISIFRTSMWPVKQPIGQITYGCATGVSLRGDI